MTPTLCRAWRTGLVIFHGAAIAACDYDAFDEGLNNSRSTSVIEMRVCLDEQVLDSQSLLVDVVFSAPMVSIEPIDGELWANGAWSKDRTCVAPFARENHTNTFSALVRPTGPSTALEVTAWDLPEKARPATGILTGSDCPGTAGKIAGRRYLLLASAVARDCRTVFEPIIEAGAPSEAPSSSASSNTSSGSGTDSQVPDAAPPTPKPPADGGTQDASTSGPTSTGATSTSSADSTITSTPIDLDGGSDAN